MFESAELGHRIAKSDSDREEQSLRARLLRRSFRFDLSSLPSHPLDRTLGLASQDVPFGLEVTAEFVLAAS